MKTLCHVTLFIKIDLSYESYTISVYIYILTHWLCSFFREFENPIVRILLVVWTKEKSGEKNLLV